MDERKMIAMDAAMEGESTIIRNIGRKVKVSEMELIALCNVARLGCLSAFSALDGEVGERASAEMDCFLTDLQTFFEKDRKGNGVHRIVQSCVAMLGQERFNKYIVASDTTNP